MQLYICVNTCVRMYVVHLEKFIYVSENFKTEDPFIKINYKVSTFIKFFYNNFCSAANSFYFVVYFIFSVLQLIKANALNKNRVRGK